MTNEKYKPNTINPLKSIESIFKLNLFLNFILVSLLINTINTEECIVSNITTISSQWLNNIICLGQNFRYINIATFSNGNLVVEVTSYPDSPERIFYGIKRNGEPLFPNKKYFSNITVSDETQSNNARYEAEVFTIIIDNKEYLISIGSGNNKYTELYDISNNEIISKVPSISLLKTSEILSFYNIASTFMLSGKTYIIYPFIDKEENFYIKKLLINSIDLSNNIPTEILEYYTSSRGRSASCFITDSNYIMCIFLHISQLVWQYYHIGIYDLNLSKQKEIVTDYYAVDYDTRKEFDYFMKCTHLEGDIGVFAFYGASKSIIIYKMDQYPTIIFKQLESPTSIKDYLPSIELSKKTFNDYCLLNDIIKITNTKLCFVSTPESKNVLYIVLINILENKKIALRYYTLDTYSKYGFKFLLDMRLHLYNNFISFGFSFCLQDSCDNNYNKHYAGFIIFNYPNGENFNLNLTKYILDNNDINNLVINLKDQVRIDNNIFGLEYSGIIIKEINNCNGMGFFSSLSENKYIRANSSLTKEEKIKVSFNPLKTINCHISYIYTITEPDFELYNSYAEVVNTYGSDTEDNFKKEKSIYESRVLDYFIILDQHFESNCSDLNCCLCPENNLDLCLSYEYGFISDKMEKIYFPGLNSYLIEEDIDKIDKTNEIINSDLDTNSNIDDHNHTEETSPIYNQKDSTNVNTNLFTNNIYATITISDKNIDTNEKEDISVTGTNGVIINKTCENDVILNNGCDNGKMSNEQVEEIFTFVKDNILKNDYKGDNKIIETENVVIQISTLEDQSNNNNPNISTIDLGECEGVLKAHYNLSEKDSLIVIKTDIKSEDLSSIYVQYEIFHPITKEKLDLNYCKDINIVINVLVNLDENTATLYDSLSESGYNLFDSEDDFYNDICSTYTSQNGTDMTLSDRKTEIYGAIENISMCQVGCAFESYNKTTKKAKCNCEIQKNDTQTDISKIDFSSTNFVRSFISTLKNSNFLVMKCYKIAFNFLNFVKNKGRIIMTIIYILFLTTFLIYIIKDRKVINVYINMILKNKSIIFELSNLKKEKEIKKKGEKKKGKKRKVKKKKAKEMLQKTDKENQSNNKENINNTYKESLFNNRNSIRSSIRNTINNNIEENKNKIFESTTNIEIINRKIMTKEPPKKRKKKKIHNKNMEFINNITNSTTKPINSLSLSKMSKIPNELNINIFPIKNFNYERLDVEFNKKEKKYTVEKIDKGEYNNILMNNNKFKDSKDISNNKSNELNDQELNTLEYSQALIIDKRTYIQYYWSLLKKKHLILFTFLPANDYNLLTIKISLFLLAFSLYFTINGFFFSDDSMHKIHVDQGKFNLFFQIPQILYSVIISAIINAIVKVLSLSENNILKIKGEKDLDNATKKAKNVEIFINIKIIIFFIISNILLLFFWYYISCFCGVYANTQIILIKDTLISFGLSMIYPFGFIILPGIFRLQALRTINKDKKILYKISQLIAYII